jgi:hypothetical protein
MKKINLILIFVILVLTLSFNVFATENYDKETAIPINAEYSEDDVLTHANTNMTIVLPDGNTDVLADNIALTEISDGVFSDTYTTRTQTGTYVAFITYYNDTWSELGSESQSFTVGETDTLNVFFYPALLICLVLIVVGFVSKNGLIGILGGLGMVFLSFMLTGAFFTITIIGGCLISLSMLLVQE